MQVYLLDTNVVSDWLDATRSRHEAIAAAIEERARADAVLLTSTVVLGEIEYGIHVAASEHAKALAALRVQLDAEFVHRRLLLDVSRTTAGVYGDLRARLFEKYAPGRKRRKGMRPEQLTDPETSLSLGIQENDLWIAAQAIERNLVLVSNDAMRRIRKVAPELKVEDWAEGMQPRGDMGQDV